MKPDSENELVEKGHGRIETRNCKVFQQIQLLEGVEKWKGLKSVIQITTEREIHEKKKPRYGCISVVYWIMQTRLIILYACTGALKTVYIGLWI